MKPGDDGALRLLREAAPVRDADAVSAGRPAVHRNPLAPVLRAVRLGTGLEPPLHDHAR
ncbi:hypothetical protein ACQEU3_41960 [Spirillospora sp. CA-253888]